jgi:hypothetical protein
MGWGQRWAGGTEFKIICRETELGLQCQARPGKSEQDPISKASRALICICVIPATWEVEVRGLQSKAGPRQQQKDEGVVQVADCLPSQHEFDPQYPQINKCIRDIYIYIAFGLKECCTRSDPDL